MTTTSTSTFVVKVGSNIVASDLSYDQAKAIRIETGGRMMTTAQAAADGVATETAQKALEQLGERDMTGLQFSYSPAFLSAADADRQWGRTPEIAKPEVLGSDIRSILAVELSRPQTVSYAGKISMRTLAACVGWLEKELGVSLGYDLGDAGNAPTPAQRRYVHALAAWLAVEPRMPRDGELSVAVLAQYRAMQR